MPLILIRKDITAVEADAIVNAANETLLGGGGVDGAIHAAAGPELREECRALGGCRPGEAKLTGAYRLRAKYIIHTVGPRWQGGGQGEAEILRACYRNALALAGEKGCSSVAFPLISSGSFGYPREEALAVAEEEIRRFLRFAEMTVYLTIFGRKPLSRDRDTAALLSLLQPPALSGMGRMSAPAAAGAAAKTARKPLLPRRKKDRAAGTNALASEETAAPAPLSAPAPAMADAWDEDSPAGLAEALEALDESFSQMLLRKITEEGMTDAECYKRANIDRKLFSKIRSDVHYRPSKPTVLAFAVALELGIAETRELLGKAGFALSRSSKFDVIVEYFIRRELYDIDRINNALFDYDQPLLGC